MYNLRSKSVKRESLPKQVSYHYSSGDMPDKQVKINLNRMPILETAVSQDSVFQVQNGKVMIKKNDVRGSKVKNILFIALIGLIITIILALYYNDEYNKYGSNIAKRLVLLPNKLKNLYSNLINTLYTKWKLSFIGQPYGSALKNKKEPHKVKRKSEVCYNDIRDFINEFWFKMKSVENIMEQQSLSFIEEQCRMENFAPRIADYMQYSYNETYTGFDVNSLIDYASYDRGARILFTFGAEPYVEYKVQSGILQYILGIKYFSIDEDILCQISTALCRYFVTGPSSLLQPWSKPGECWSFKGTRGRVRIELSERIYLTAVSLEHIPEGFATPGTIRSAPARFSITGLDDTGGYEYQARIHLGTYKYLLNEPNIQTFNLSKEDSSHPYKIIEFNIESNHGNENYTCVYRLRIHGRPITSLQN